MFAVHYARGSGWGRAERVATARTEAPRVAAHADGRALIFWDDIDEATALRYVLGQGYSAPVRVAVKDDITTPFRPPVLVPGPNGSFWMMWLVSRNDSLHTARFVPNP